MRDYFTPVEGGQAARGAALLDERMPGWYKRIDLRSLNLASEYNCVLGQLYPESCNLPLWQIYEYPSREDFVEAAMKGSIGSMRTRPEAEEYADMTSCRANYDLGKLVIFADVADSIERDILCLDHGFLAGYEFANVAEIRTRLPHLFVSWDDDRWQYMDRTCESTYDGLDLAWTHEINLRKTVDRAVERAEKEYNEEGVSVRG